MMDNELQIKPGHALVMGKHVIAQVPIDAYDGYKDKGFSFNAERITVEWGSAYKVLFPIDGELQTWNQINENTYGNHS